MTITTTTTTLTSAQRRFNNDIDSDDEDDEIDIGVVASSATSPQLTVISRADSDAKIAAARAKVLRRHQTLFDAIDNENNIDAFHLLLKEMLTQVNILFFIQSSFDYFLFFSLQK